MAKDKLETFYNDKEMRQLVQSNFRNFVRGRAADLAQIGESTAGIKDAVIAVDAFFQALANEYEPKKKKEVESPE